MNFSAPEATTTLAVLVRQHAAAGSDLRIDQLDGWHNPQASTAAFCVCYSGVAPVSDGHA